MPRGLFPHLVPSAPGSHLPHLRTLARSTCALVGWPLQVAELSHMIVTNVARFCPPAHLSLTSLYRLGYNSTPLELRCTSSLAPFAHFADCTPLRTR
jgi:hypothetical protein